jgi:hypothetical protein
MLSKRFLVVIALVYFGICSSVGRGQKSASSIQTNQQGVSITNVEPGVYTLQKLFDAADDVSIVEVVAGNTESYESAVYKAKVLTRFKGAATGETIYFGPYEGTRLGGKYLVFLRAAKVISPLHRENLGFGPVRMRRCSMKAIAQWKSLMSAFFQAKRCRCSAATAYVYAPTTSSCQSQSRYLLKQRDIRHSGVDGLDVMDFSRSFRL